MLKFVLVFLTGNVVYISSGNFVPNFDSWNSKINEGVDKVSELAREDLQDVGKNW